jgi:asparagine synthase (glutamine-hydrolysing)
VLRECMPARGVIQRVGGKALLAGSPVQALPEAVLNRPKTGFTTPVPVWQQSVPALQAWREIPMLQADSTPWARRYAVAILQQQKAMFA